ncbi:MAG: TPM domain-containing protein [Thermoanaerobaculia bacterium]|nr:TPM domain-containing protein [Thermoanaerobaculia bacterium]
MGPPPKPLRRIAVAAAAILLAVGLVLLWPAASSSPVLVDDEAALLSAEQRRFVSRFHALLVDDHDIDYRVVTVSDVGDVDRYAVERFEDSFGDSRSRSGRGLLLVVDAGQDLVRMEVAYALEPVFPDAFVAYVEREQMVPFFRAGRIADGILAATELVVTRAQRAAAEAGFESEVWATASGGGGAVSRAEIGAGGGSAPATEGRIAGGRAPAADTPAAVLEAYLTAMANRDGRPDLPFYSSATRRMLRDWVVTPAQMDSVVRTYRGCTPEPARFAADGMLAVIRYPVSERACAPFFFERAADGWRLDLTLMQQAIRFGRSNAWRFDPAVRHPYGFGFEDWSFDAVGFPQEETLLDE